MRVRGVPSRSFFVVSVVALAAALALGVASAQAKTVNLVPNPGFELGPCGFQGPVICDWFEFPNDTIVQDFSNPHSGLASMNVSGPPAEVDAGTSGVPGTPGCVKLHPGPHAASFWYRTTDRVATLVNFVVHWWPSTDCSGAAPSGELITNSPITDGAWHQLTGTLMAPPGTGSANFGVGEGCGVGCTAPLSANFDDLYLEGHVRNTPGRGGA
jgi:hypothetical protein